MGTKIAMQFFIYHGTVYAHGQDVGYALDTQGFDEPNQWVWHVIPAAFFGHILFDYRREHKQFGPSRCPSCGDVETVRGENIGKCKDLWHQL